MTTTALMTANELLRLPDDGRHRYELAPGELITMAPPGFAHGGTAAAFTWHAQAYVRLHGGGRVVVETGFLVVVRDLSA